jgi:hypothetical protein
VLVLVLIFILLFAGLAVILAAGTVSIQSNIYSEPTTGIQWKAPTAAAILTVFYALWMIIDYRALDPNRNDFPYDTIFRFSPKEIYDVDQLWAVKNNQEILFKRQAGDTIGASKYVDPLTGQQWSRGDATGLVSAILIDDKKVRLEPKLTPEGNFLPGAEAFPGYYEVKGRRRMENLGQVSTFRWGLYIGNWVLNILHLVVWFVPLWLLLRFQWSHALFIAAILWGIATLWIVPMLLEKTYRVAQQRAGIQTSLVRPASQVEARMCMMSPSLTTYVFPSSR